MAQCFRCESYDVSDYSSICIGGSTRVYACSACRSLTVGQGIDWKTEVHNLYTCAVTLQQLHTTSPQHKAFVEHRGSVEDYAREHPEHLRKFAGRIREKAAATFSDPIFTTFLKRYFPHLFRIANFDLDALEEVERQDRENESKRQQLTFQFGSLDHYEKTEWLTRYAVRHRSDLLKRHQAIHEAHERFHADTAFMTYLTERAPHIYTRATWEFRALAYAESHQETPKEYRARHDQISWDDLDAELSAEEQAIRQAIVTKLWADKLTQRLIDEGYPEDIVKHIVAGYLKTNLQGASSTGHTDASPLAEVY